MYYINGDTEYNIELIRSLLCDNKFKIKNECIFVK